MTHPALLSDEQLRVNFLWLRCDCKDPECGNVEAIRAHLSTVSAERDRMREELNAADVLASAVQTVIYAQTNFTIDVVGIDKMREQRKALEAYQKAVAALAAKEA